MHVINTKGENISSYHPHTPPWALAIMTVSCIAHVLVVIILIYQLSRTLYLGLYFAEVDGYLLVGFQFSLVNNDHAFLSGAGKRDVGYKVESGAGRIKGICHVQNVEEMDIRLLGILI